MTKLSISNYTRLYPTISNCCAILLIFKSKLYLSIIRHFIRLLCAEIRLRIQDGHHNFIFTLFEFDCVIHWHGMQYRWCIRISLKTIENLRDLFNSRKRAPACMPFLFRAILFLKSCETPKAMQKIPVYHQRPHLLFVPHGIFVNFLLNINCFHQSFITSWHRTV